MRTKLTVARLKSSFELDRFLRQRLAVALDSNAPARPYVVEIADGAVYIVPRPPVPDALLSALALGELCPAGQSKRAVVFIHHGGRLYAIFIGDGRHCLKPDDLDPTFGMDLIARHTKPDSVASIDRRTWDGPRRRVVSSSDDPQPQAVHGVTGADVVHRARMQLSRLDLTAEGGARTIRVPWDHNDVHGLIAVLHELACSDGLPDPLTILGLRPVSADERSELDALVDARPSIAIMRSHVDELRWRDSALPRDLAEALTETREVDSAKAWAMRQRVTDANGDRHGSLWQHFQGEVQHGDGSYVLEEGSWYLVPAKTLDHWREQLDQLLTNAPGPLQLNQWPNEDGYNKAVCNGSCLVLLDKKLYTTAGTAHVRQRKVELADLYDPSSHRAFAVKRYRGGTSGCSHLFVQAEAGARLMCEPAGQEWLNAQPSLAHTQLRSMTLVVLDERRRETTFPYLFVRGLLGVLNRIAALGIDARWCVVRPRASTQAA